MHHQLGVQRDISEVFIAPSTTCSERLQNDIILYVDVQSTFCEIFRALSIECLEYLMRGVHSILCWMFKVSSAWCSKRHQVNV
jgi:hypothetical protein